MSSPASKAVTFTADGITPPKPSSERNLSKEKKGYAYYDRIIPYKKPLEERSAEYASLYPTSSSLSDKVSTLFSSESKADRLVRRKLTHYRGVLSSELKIVERSLQHYTERVSSLAAGFSSQEAQLKRWGLQYALPAFNEQKWVRTTRNNLLRDASHQIKRVLETRLAEVEFFVKALAEDRGKKHSHVHNLDDQFFLYPGELLGRDAEYVRLRYRVGMIDKMCSVAHNKLQLYLPDLNSKASAERKVLLQTILESYASMLSSEPSADTLGSMSWPQYCEWLMLRQRTEASILLEFGSFVEDEREREGRLFCRWCAILRSEDAAEEQEEERTKVAADINSTENEGLALLDAIGVDEEYLSPRKTLSKSSSPAPSAGRTSPATDPISPEDVDFASPQYQLKCMSHVKCIRGFIRYFAINVLSTAYSVPGPQQSQLLALTDTLVHRRISSTVYRLYDYIDAKWLYQCQVCRGIDPRKFGVPDSYLSIPSSLLSENRTIDVTRIESEVSSCLDHVVSCVEMSCAAMRARSVSTSSTNRATPRTHKPSAAMVFLPACEALQSQAKKLAQRCENISLVTAIDASHEPHLLFYGRAARLLSTITLAMSPKEVFFVVMQAMTLLQVCATDISSANNNGKREVLGADLMFPLLVMTLAHANVPNIHFILEYLHHFSDIDSYGEIAYYVTSIEAAVEFIDQLDARDPRRNSASLTPRDSVTRPDSGRRSPNAKSAGCSTSMAKTCHFGCSDMPANTALVYLGSWLRNQQLMEDTMIAMQKEGLIS